MSRSRKNKYDSDAEVTLKRTDIKAYSEEDAFPVYIPTQNSKVIKEKKKKKKVLLIIFLIFFIILAGIAGASGSAFAGIITI